MTPPKEEGAPPRTPTPNEPTATDSTRPYGSTAFKYRTAGWPGSLPAGTPDKPLDKDPRQTGFTGWKHADVWPDDDQLAEWVRTRGHYNIALRLPRNVVGLDVDAWKGETYVETMKAITAVHGMLPRTWVSTSRSDSSGIRLFRLLFDVKQGDLAGDLNHPTDKNLTAGEVIHHGHRVAVVWPSVHPDTGDPYIWIDQTTGEVSERIPRPSELPELTPEWIDHLRGDCSCFFWLKIRMTGSKDPVADTFTKWHDKLTSATYSRHDAALGGSLALVSFRKKGWPEAAEYLGKLEAAFLASVTADRSRTDREARDEWARMIEGAEAKATPDPPYEPPRPADRKEPAKEATTPEGRRIQLTAAANIDPLPVRWLWEGRIPVGEITLTPGLAGVGKSTFHTWLIAQLTKGTLPGVHYGTPQTVIICAREDSWERSIVPRLIAADADLNRVWRAEVITDGDQRTKLTLPADNAALEREIRRLNVALVSLDPLLSTIDKSFDSNKGREIREALEPLQTIADETRCVILGNAHFNKTSGGDPLLRITGSAAFGEVCRAALAFARDNDTGERVISQVKNNLGRMDLPNLAYRLDPVTIPTEEGPSEVTRLVFTGESARGVREILNPHPDLDKGQRDIARDIILDRLERGPHKWEAITAALKKEDISPATGQRARDELRKAGLIDKDGGGGQPWTWHRKELAHSRVPVSSEQVEQVPYSPEEELTQRVSRQNANGDAYLLNLAKEEEKLREAACGGCGHMTSHFAMCPTWRTEEEESDLLTAFGGRP